jgi:FkbM family methyltransferase
MLLRLRKLARRAVIARRLGVCFTGTQYFRPPDSAILRGECRTLSFPDDQTLAHDVIEVWLDDDYGLGTITRSVHSVLDIGANVGLFSLWAWRYFPEARIHSYEPNPLLQSHLAANLRDLPDVTIWAEGVSDRSGRAQLDQGANFRLAQTRADETGDVTLVALRTAVERLGGQVDLLKLDCEGAEWTIFRDAEAFVNVRELRMEYHLTEGRELGDLRAAAQSLEFEIIHLCEHQSFGIAHLRNSRAMDPAATKPQEVS